MKNEKGVAYILGILSLVLSFFQPLPAIIIGIVGLIENKKDKSKTAKKLNILGIIIGILMLVLVVVVSQYLASQMGTAFPSY